MELEAVITVLRERNILQIVFFSLFVKPEAVLTILRQRKDGSQGGKEEKEGEEANSTISDCIIYHCVKITTE